MILSSKLKIEGINYKELLIFLRKNLSTKEIKEKNLTHLIPDKISKKKKNKRGEDKNDDKNKNKPKDDDEKEDKDKDKNDEQINEKDNNGNDSWNFSEVNFTVNEQKQMISEAISIAINLIMNNHIYVFDGKVFLQENEGSIGIRLTGILAEIVMIFWCKKLSEKLENIGIKNDLLPRFVDDITMLPTVVPPGVRFEDEKLVLHEKYINDDEKVDEDNRTMNVIQKVANSISENIEVTYDVPSNYDDGKIPILDVKAGLNPQNKIEFQFYKKPMTNPLVTLKSSALPMHQKFTILTQQCFSRLHNTSVDVEEQVKVEILNDFMKELKASGYTEKDRENILMGAVNTFKNLKSKEILK